MPIQLPDDRHARDPDVQPAHDPFGNEFESYKTSLLAFVEMNKDNWDMGMPKWFNNPARDKFDRKTRTHQMVCWGVMKGKQDLKGKKKAEEMKKEFEKIHSVGRDLDVKYREGERILSQEELEADAVKVVSSPEWTSAEYAAKS